MTGEDSQGAWAVGEAQCDRSPGAAGGGCRGGQDQAQRALGRAVAGTTQAGTVCTGTA